jgi:hypothetical protein
MSWFSRNPSPGAWTWPYTPDARDRVVVLDDVPHPDPGAPLPTVLANDYALLLLYLLPHGPADWDGTTVQVVGSESDGLPVAVVEFQQPYAHILGPPNDEAIAGHPLAYRGAVPYGVYEVEGSSWIRAMERMNRVHPYHKPQRFDLLHHYVFTFHESVFECAANDLVVRVERGSIATVAASVLDRLP